MINKTIIVALILPEVCFLANYIYFTRVKLYEYLDENKLYLLM